MTTYYVSAAVSSSGNGTSWAAAWKDTTNISWGSLASGDIIEIDGGTTSSTVTPYDFGPSSPNPGVNCGTTYSPFTVGASNITIRRSRATGRNGTVVISGGRTLPLPYCGQVTYTGGSSNAAIGIDCSGQTGVTIDGQDLSGIIIRGAQNGLKPGTAGGNTFRNLEIFDNGFPTSTGTGPAGGTYNSDGNGILTAGNNTYDRLLIHDNGGDEFHSDSSGTGSSASGSTVTNCWMGAIRSHPSYNYEPFNDLQQSGGGYTSIHSDGWQTFTPLGTMTGLSFDHCVVGPGPNQGIFPGDAAGAACNNLTVTNTLFLAPVQKCIGISYASNGWTLNQCTFYAPMLQAASITGNGNSVVTNCIQYGGDFTNSGMTWTGSGSNVAWNFTSSSLPSSVNANPGFGSNPGTGAFVPIATLLTTTLTPSGTYASYGSPLHSLTDLLNRIDSLNGVSMPPVLPVGNPPGGGAGGWQIVFNDNFSWGGQAPNPATWTNRPWGTNGSGNNSNEIEWIPANNQNVSYANGVLTMQAQNMGSFSAVHAADPTAVSPMANGQTPTYLGSFFTTLPGFAYTYGYAEIYCAFPQGAVSGFWPAFWQVSSLDGWPPEIDTCEFNTGNNAQVHNGYYDMSNTWHNAYYSTSASSYHAYGVALLPGTVAFYLDGVQTYSTSYDGHAFPWSLIMNVAVTTQAGGGYPASMNVQYVRAWTVSGVPAQPVISSISPANGIPTAGSLSATFAAVPGATSYRVSAFPTATIADGSDTNVNTAYATGTGTTLTVNTNLKNGAHYSMTVCALNASGYSIESFPVPALGPAPPTPPTPPTPPSGTWTLVASENFTTNTLATNFAVYNNGTATAYEANSWMASQVTVNTSTKQLLMNAKGSGGERVGGAWQWLGAGGAANQLFGAWEIDYYTQNGAGYWPVLLMWANATWPVDGEIDVFEWYNAQPPVATHIGGSTNLHLATTANVGNHLGIPNARSNSTPANVSAGNYQIDLSHGPNADGTHTVRLEWQETYIAVYVDGTLVSSCSDMSWIPNTKSMVLTLQQEFYGTTDSSVPSLNANTVVTGLRAYKYSGVPFAGAAMSTLSDNFAVNSLASRWYNSDTAVTVSGGVASIPSTVNYWQLASTTAYNLTGSYFSAKISPSSTSGAETDLHLLAGIQIIEMYQLNGTLGATLTQGEAVLTTVGTTTYNATNHAYWKISESGGILTWAASPDGSTWTTLWTHAYTMEVTALMALVNVGQSSGTGNATTVTSVNPGGGNIITATGALRLSPLAFSAKANTPGGTLALQPLAFSGTGNVPLPLISLVQHASGTSTTNTVTVTLAPTGAGNALIVVAGYGYSGSDANLASITLGGNAANWASQYYNPGTNAGDIAVWGNFNIQGSQTTLVVNANTGLTPIMVDVYEVSGLAPIVALDKTVTSESDGTGSTWTSPATGGLSQAQEFAVGVVTAYAGGAFTFTGPAVNWTNETQLSGGTTIAQLSGYQITGSTAALTYSGTSSATLYYQAAVVTFRGVTRITSSGAVSLSPLKTSGLVNTGRAGSIAVDGTSPPVVALTNTRATSLTTASFTPPANTMLAVLASFEYQTTGNGAPVLTVSDSASGTYTTGPSVYDGISAQAAIWTQYLYNSPGAITVSLAVTAAAPYGAILAVYVLDGPTSIQTGVGHATATPTVPTTGWTGNITTTKIGSWVMIAASGAAQASVTPSGITTLEDYQDTAEGASLLTARQATVTSVPGVTPLGWTSSKAGSFAWAALEILPAVPVIRPFALTRTAVRQASLY